MTFTKIRLCSGSLRIGTSVNFSINPIFNAQKILNMYCFVILLLTFGIHITCLLALVWSGSTIGTVDRVVPFGAMYFNEVGVCVLSIIFGMDIVVDRLLNGDC